MRGRDRADLPDTPLRRVLIVAPDFAPSSYPPALRVRFFARHLPDFGWRPTVLAIDPRHYEWDVDPENLALLSDDLDVVRCGALPAGITRRIGLGDLSARGLPHLGRTIRRLHTERPFDLLFCSVPPYYTALLGRWAYERLGLPYVVDYIDPWVSDYWKREPGARALSKRALSAAAARVLEPLCLRRAAHVTGVSQGTTDEILARCDWLGPDDATEIPYGGEAADFDYLRRSPRKNPIFDPHDGFVHLSYVGRGGADMVPALEAVFAAVKRGLERAPELFGRLRLHFVGTSYAPGGERQVLPIAERAGVARLVDEHPARVPYLDALKILVESHGLLVVGSYATHYTASKIFPYILAERPLIALFHEKSTVVDILRETRGGTALTFSEAEPPIACADALTEQLQAVIEDRAGCTPSYARSAFERYTTRAMTRRLAGVFDRVVGRRDEAAESQHAAFERPEPAPRPAEVAS